MHSRSNWNLEVLVFEERGKPEYPEKNLSEQGRETTTTSTQIIMASTQGFEPGPHWWEESALTTEPPLLQVALTPMITNLKMLSVYLNRNHTTVDNFARTSRNKQNKSYLGDAGTQLVYQSNPL